MRTAIVIGATRPFGAAIVARLERDGFAVATVESVEQMTGDAPIDVFVLNMPVQPGNIRFLDISDDDFRGAMREQIHDVAAAGQAAAARMGGGGSIVHVASRAHLGAWGGAHTMAAGAAMVGMSRSMALELVGQGVRVNVLAPDFAGAAWDTPEAQVELAGAVAFLAGSDSALLNGETLLLDRGRSLAMTETRRR